MFLLSSFGVINMQDLVGMAHGKCCSDFLTQFSPSLVVLFFLSCFCFLGEKRHILMVLEGEYLRRLG